MCLHQSGAVTLCYVLRWTNRDVFFYKGCHLWQFFCNPTPCDCLNCWSSPMDILVPCSSCSCTCTSPCSPCSFCSSSSSHHSFHRTARALGSVHLVARGNSPHTFSNFLLLFTFCFLSFWPYTSSNTLSCPVPLSCLSVCVSLFFTSLSASPMLLTNVSLQLLHGGFLELLHSLVRDALCL